MRVRMFVRNHFIRGREAHRRVVHNSFHLFKGNSTRVEVYRSVNNLSALTVFALVGSGHSALNRLNHRAAADAAIVKLSEHCVDGFQVNHMEYVCRTFIKKVRETDISDDVKIPNYAKCV